MHISMFYRNEHFYNSHFFTYSNSFSSSSYALTHKNRYVEVGEVVPDRTLVWYFIKARITNINKREIYARLEGV